MRAHGTEAPGSCALLQENRPSRFSCVGCGQPLLESRLKFESGTGWPSFNDPIEGAVETSTDHTHGNRHDKRSANGRVSSATRRFHDASLFDRLVRRTLARSSMACSGVSVIC
ncbi:MAG: peptide-methionine (R)-S-oxide reductase, partial [Acetobacteraceae bacterium]